MDEEFERERMRDIVDFVLKSKCRVSLRDIEWTFGIARQTLIKKMGEFGLTLEKEPFRSKFRYFVVFTKGLKTLEK